MVEEFFLCLLQVLLTLHQFVMQPFKVIGALKKMNVWLILKILAVAASLRSHDHNPGTWMPESRVWYWNDPHMWSFLSEFPQAKSRGKPAGKLVSHPSKLLQPPAASASTPIASASPFPNLVDIPVLPNIWLWHPHFPATHLQFLHSLPGIPTSFPLMTCISWNYNTN